jgi:signal transduction histidine kinase/ActR/RegA family two-component response regulator
LAYHKLLERQIRKNLPLGVGEDENLSRFIQAVSDAYYAFDRDKQLSEHAFQVSEKDYLDIYDRLKAEIDIRNQSIKKLKESIWSMEPDANAGIIPGENNLLDVIGYLNEQISKRKAAEQALIDARELAEKANQAKSEFLSVMSHEIRTPLNAVIGLGHILYRQNPRPDQLNNLQVLRTSADNLLSLINDILDFNKIDAGKLELDNSIFDLKATAEDVFHAISIKANERGNEVSIYIDPSIPHQVLGDAHRLMQVLNNLLSNAVKFTTRGKVQLTLQLEKITSSKCSILFSVSDTGIGIQKDKLDHIFNPFSQASSSITREFGGTGLGLAITADLLRLMNSEIKVDAEVGRGSNFYFTLELAYASEMEAMKGSSTFIEEDLGQAKILLVEDTPFNVLFTTQLLEGWNTVIEVAENGAIAVEKVKTDFYDLVIMDLHMPVMDGYTATRKIREFNQHTPIIALTASATVDIEQKIFDAGMQDFVTKPFNPDDLFFKIQASIASSRK